ncbi:MAG: hypothetical protein ACRD8U_23995, partial [Pyrinomonadaceae bacterium]
MGRVFDALKRASAQKGGQARRRPSHSSEHPNGRGDHGLPTAKQIEEELFRSSSILKKADDVVQSSASTAHTADAPDGSA